MRLTSSSFSARFLRRLTLRNLSATATVAAFVAGCGSAASPTYAASSTSEALILPSPAPTHGPIYPPGHFQFPVEPAGCDSPKPITDLGYPTFRVYSDVNGDGKADYCRFVGNPGTEFLSCQLACPLSGNYGNSTGFDSIQGIDQGAPGTQFMLDLDYNHGTDFCRTVGNPGFIACDLAKNIAFDPNPNTIVVPPGLPMFSTAITDVEPPTPTVGQSVAVTVQITNNLPIYQLGAVEVDLTPLGGAYTTTTQVQLTLDANTTVTQKVTFTPPAGKFNLNSAYLAQHAQGTPTYPASKSAPQLFKVQALPTPPTVTFYPSGSASSASGQTLNVIQGNTVNANFTVDPGPYCETSHWRIEMANYQYKPGSFGGATVETGISASPYSGSVNFHPNMDTPVAIVALCDAHPQQVGDPNMQGYASFQVKMSAPPPPPPPTSPTSCVPFGAAEAKSVTVTNASSDTLTIWTSNLTTNAWGNQGELAPGASKTIDGTTAQNCQVVQVIALDNAWIDKYNAQFETTYAPDQTITAQTSNFWIANTAPFFVQTTAGAATLNVN